MAPRKKKASRPAPTQLPGSVDTLRHARTGHDGGGGEQPTRDKAKATRREEALIYGCPIVDTGWREKPLSRRRKPARLPQPGKNSTAHPGTLAVSWRGPTAAGDLAHGHGQQIAPSVHCHSS
ncbi:hypothetical protein IscW_ISCW021511 [Ixodes scapularis]|uniref:Uncharacterized protein n=1 Tax=Ixodes scapularis TaxID=6945 RepID=B7Q971_IXOSC|nr:hypothetical protein IscW_ISCW021511 [Ixodes scapularis]|eukprot:XP_002412465.1 hypothetical protein IscW_ISCW021511 [Ixodes scapularis]